MIKSEFKNRKRIISYRWKRIDDGPLLPRPPPNGKRPPNGLIWASSLDRIYRIERIPNVAVMTAWSISMIEEFNENYHEVADIIKPEPDPEMIMPFPLLTLPVEICEPDGTPWYTARMSIQGLNRGILPHFRETDAPKSTPFGKSFETEYKLEEFIPAVFFPDFLIVNDPQGITEGKRPKNSSPALEDHPRKYKRVWPLIDPATLTQFPQDTKSTKDDERDKVAYLNLAGAPLLGKGHHSVAHRAALSLPSGVEAYSPDGSCAVAAKIALPTRGARGFLHNEGEVYNRIYGKATNVGMNIRGHVEGAKAKNKAKERDGCRHLMEHWEGYNLLTPDIHYPVPVGAVVPKFFGYYVPTEEAESVAKERKKRNLFRKPRAKEVWIGDEDSESGDRVDEEIANEDEYWTCNDYYDDEANSPADTLLSPILLIEDCGEPIRPEKMSIDDRTECLSFLVRLYFEHISHSSFHARNILVQPGPLSKPPHQRSLNEPSFRVIDLGRALHWETHINNELKKYEAKNGKELPKEILPVGPDGYIRDDLEYTETQKEWRRIALTWSLSKDEEIQRARMELLMDPLGAD